MRMIAGLSNYNCRSPHVAIAPIFARFERFDDCVICRMKMFGCVFVRTGITTADVSAHFAKSQMHPPTIRFQTIFTAVRARRNFFHLR